MNLFDLLPCCCVVTVHSLQFGQLHICFSFLLHYSLYHSALSSHTPYFSLFPPLSLSLSLSRPCQPTKLKFNSIFNKRFYYIFYSIYCVDSKRFRTIFYTKQAFELFICFMLFSRCALAVNNFLKLFNQLQCVLVIIVLIVFLVFVAVVDVSFLFIITFCFCCFGLFWSFVCVCVSSFILIVFFKWRKFAAFIIPKK